MDGVRHYKSKTGTNIPASKFTQTSGSVTLSTSTNIWKDQSFGVSFPCMSYQQCLPALDVYSISVLSCLQGQQTYYDPFQSDMESLAGYDSFAESGLGIKYD